MEVYPQREKKMNPLLERLQNRECSLVYYLAVDGHQTGLQGQYFIKVRIPVYMCLHVCLISLICWSGWELIWAEVDLYLVGSWSHWSWSRGSWSHGSWSCGRTPQKHIGVCTRDQFSWDQLPPGQLLPDQLFMKSTAMRSTSTKSTLTLTKSIQLLKSTLWVISACQGLTGIDGSVDRLWLVC